LTSINKFDRIVFHSLFYELETEEFNISYKHGFFRLVLILLQTLLFSSHKENYKVNIKSNKTTAITFFNNEHNAILNFNNKINIHYHLKLNIHNLFIIRKTLGLKNILYEITRFFIFTFIIKGYKYLRKQTYPLLGWLLYKAFVKILISKKNVRTVTTNMVHPLSLAIFWASIATKHCTDFIEHATTPKIIVKNRNLFFFGKEYSKYYVKYHHTRQMLIENNICSLKINTLLPKFNYKYNKIIKKVGICINVHDSVESISLITSALRELDLIYSYRLHDADPRISYFQKLAVKENIYLSNANNYPIQVFLKNIDLLIAGNSDVLSDAMVAGIQPIYFWIGPKGMYDYYGFLKYYDIPHANSRESLKKVIEKVKFKKC
jgi:hypothetical protein